MKTMDKELVESIEKYEQKREFREVKLQIRQSFREDQDALVKRLSKYRQKKMPSECQNGQDNNGYASDIDKQSESNDKVTDLDGIKVDVNGGNVLDAATSESGSVSHHQKHADADGSVSDRSSTGYTNGCNGVGNLNTPNGSVSSNSSGMVRPNGLKGRQVGSLTPEARPKFGKRLYEKNAKLTASSTDHLDKVSIRGVRPSNQMYHHGQRTGENKPLLVPVAQGAEVKSIPANGNLQEFSADQMVTVFRLLRFPEELIFRLHRNKVNGKRFSLFTDKDFESMGMGSNPLVKHFRDRSIATAKKKSKKFML